MSAGQQYVYLRTAKIAVQDMLNALTRLEHLLLTQEQASYLQRLVEADSAGTQDYTLRQQKQELAAKLRWIGQ